MDTPTTTASATAFTQDQWASKVGSAVAAKVLDAERQQGAGALQLLAAASLSPASTAAENGVGGTLDVAG